ncbi:MAG TPA: hypothetical protein VE954_23185 [Oligoflexus sp.]|uniref:hypothetical protein n=1 Tax=Oligoflexus sp. TaxID=1971216 RepID=UPI002D63C530|nr:hypothetical protein [Oligoflexus sp.]HYX36016.1 hypothetical protein [Oligoflexus sp.]
MIEAAIRDVFPKFDVAPVLGVRLSTDPEIQEAILWEYGLTELLPYAVKPETLKKEALEFIRIRGTLHSIRMAMRWVGFNEIKFNRLSWYEYEIDPGAIPKDQQIDAIKAALAVSVQARGILRRIYHESFEVKYG